MSPRPTNADGNNKRSPKLASSGSTYLAVAMLPSRTTSQRLPAWRNNSWASRSRGRRRKGLRVSEFSAKIQAADEGEQFSDGKSVVAQAARQYKARIFAHDH